jgi:antirestriction protein ArdC
VEDFYFTLCHELGSLHGTHQPTELGSKHLKRWKTSRREQYAFEEVVADITASLLMQQAGLTPDLPNSASIHRGVPQVLVRQEEPAL